MIERSSLEVSGPIRVAIVTHDFTEAGGVATVVRTFFDALSSDDAFRPRIISLATSRADPQSVRLKAPRTWRRGISVVSGERKGYPFTHVGSMLAEIEPFRYRPRRALTELVKQHDIVQVVGGFAAWAQPALSAGRPVAIQFATTAALERRTRIREESGPRRIWTIAMTKWAGRAENRAIREASLVLVENEEMEAMCRTAATGRVMLLPPPVDVNRFPRRPDPLGGGEFLLSVGRFSDPRKATKILFQAYAEATSLVKDMPPLMLVGDPPTSDDLLHARRLGIHDSLQLKGRLPDDELAAMYRACQAFVLPSDQEGLGLVLLEAMSSGAPVISTETEGARMVIEPEVTGLLVPVRTPSALAHAMTRMVNESGLRRRLAAAGHSAVIDRFSLSSFSRELKTAYEQVLTSRRRR